MTIPAPAYAGATGLSTRKKGGFVKKKPRNKPAGKPFQGKVIYLSRQSSQKAAGGATRLERDTMGELAVPADAYYGVQTARAIENFPISSLRLPPGLIPGAGAGQRGAPRGQRGPGVPIPHN